MTAQRGRLSYQRTSSDPEQTLEFQFNPTSLSRTRTVTLHQTPAPTRGDADASDASPAAGQTFASKANNWTMSVNIRLDSTRLLGTGNSYSFSDQLDSVESAISFLEGAVEPVIEPRESNKSVYPPERTPMVRFDWGNRSWLAQITQLVINENWFSTDLRPARVEATVSLTVIDTLSAAIAGTSGSGD